VPVVTVTGLATVVYVSATILPFIDRFCPYTTPGQKLLAEIPAIVSRVRRTAYTAVDSHWKNTSYPDLLDDLLFVLRRMLRPTEDQTLKGSSATDQEALMDLVTSQMLSWLVVNCEDSRSIDIALQAIAGATTKLPQAPLAECGAIRLVSQRLETCFQQDQTSQQYRLKDQSMLALAIVYSRSFRVLFPEKSYNFYWDRWKRSTGPLLEVWLYHFMQSKSTRIHARYVVLSQQGTREILTSTHFALLQYNRAHSRSSDQP
jgi:hypothetical protein